MKFILLQTLALIPSQLVGKLKAEKNVLTCWIFQTALPFQSLNPLICYLILSVKSIKLIHTFQTNAIKESQKLYIGT
jgi:hypothetical protein